MNLQEIGSRFENLDFLASQVVEGFITGLHKSPFHGFSVEFAEHRLYNTGESTKNIDWKLYGRTDKLFIKKYDEETNLRCHLLLDVSSSMYYPSESLDKIKFGAMAVAVIGNILKKQRDAFSLTTFDSKIQFTSDTRSSLSHYRLIINELQSIVNTKPEKTTTNVAEVLNQIAEKIHRRSLVVIISDMFDDVENSNALFDALKHMRFKKHEIIVFHIGDKKTESDFEFENRPYRFTDIETGEELKLFPNEVKENFLNKTKEFEKSIKEKCVQFKIDYNKIDTAQDFSQLLMPFYVKRMKMK